MKTVLDLLKSIFDSDKAITTEDGQRVITFDAVLPEVEGLVLFDDESGADEGGQQTNEAVNVDLTQYATAEQLGELIDRLIAIEQLVLAVDNAGDAISEEVEIW